MRHLKNFIKKYFTHFAYFYTHLRYRLFISLALSLMVAVLDGFGLAMFIPLLQVADGSGQVDAETLGNLRFLVDTLDNMGIVLTLYTVLSVIVVFFVLKGIARFVEMNYKVSIRQFFIKKLRFDNVNKLSNYNYQSFVLADSGRIQNTLSGEVTRVAQAYQSYMATMQAMGMVLVYVALAFLANPEFALLVAIGGFFSNLIFSQIYKKTKSASRKVSSDSHVYQGLLIQMVAFFKYLKATGLIKIYSNKLKDFIVRIENSNRKMGYYAAIMQAAREPLVVLVVVAVIMAQVTWFNQSIGLIILSLMFFYRALNFLMNLQNFWNSFMANAGALDNMSDFLQELSKEQERYGKEMIDGFTTAIELKDASITYGANPVLKGISLQIRKNATIAFVGESGSGKTTLVNVLTGLLPVTKGEMLIDGKSSRAINMPSWQQRIGYITQEPVIFADTIFNNVSFWAAPTEENKQRFWNALEKASIDTYVKDLPLQENAQLGVNGILISGGQKQRISIARELFKNPEILIMDEATAALDSETEKVIQQNIDKLQGAYTIIIIAHRLSTIKNADVIYLIDNGRIVASGTFDQMLSQSESFKSMVTLQEF